MQPEGRWVAHPADWGTGLNRKGDQEEGSWDHRSPLIPDCRDNVTSHIMPLPPLLEPHLMANLLRPDGLHPLSNHKILSIILPQQSEPTPPMLNYSAVLGHDKAASRRGSMWHGKPTTQDQGTKGMPGVPISPSQTGFQWPDSLW